MPTYELCLILKHMPRPEVVSTLRRTADTIFSKGGIIRKIENLGTQKLPYKMNAHGKVHRQGGYFTMQFIVPPKHLLYLQEEYARDIDIVRSNVFKLEPPEEIECTLQDEMLPPAYRKDVQEMIEKSQKVDKFKFKYNSGLDYYPFQK
ncbi:putative 28S ribosomal protein S6 [Blattella germanica]|nr:putative 28S ribosomal protein S6 [Blattella germanica]